MAKSELCELIYAQNVECVHRSFLKSSHKHIYHIPTQVITFESSLVRPNNDNSNVDSVVDHQDCSMKSLNYVIFDFEL